MPRTTSETNSNDTPLDVYSRPLVLTSTATLPAGADVVLHVSAASLTYAAGTTVALKRQRRAPIASAADEKPPPSTVKGEPPSDAPRNGHTDETAAAGRYVNNRPSPPPDVNCCPFADSVTRRAPADDDGGVAHSTWLPLMPRATDVAPLPSKRHRRVAAARKPEPTTDSRVPPATGPAGGTSALAYIGACTYRLTPLRSASPWIDSSTLDHPVGKALGDTHRTPSDP